MKRLLFFILYITHYFLFAQAPEIEWARTYGGSAYDVAEDIFPTSDGGYIVAGNSKSSDGDVSEHLGAPYSTDYWIVKLDGLGNIIWERSYGGEDQDFAHSIQQKVDGGFIIAGAGYEDTFHPCDFWIIKLNPTGELEWQSFIGDTYFSEEVYSIQQTSDEGYVFVGESYGSHGNNYDYVIVKLDSNGQIEWQNSYGGTGQEYSYSVKQTGDDGYIIAGYSMSDDGDVSNNYGGADVWIVKTDEFGNLQWEKNYGGSKHEGTGTGIVKSVDIITTISGGYAFVSSSQSSDGDVSGNHGNPSASKADYWIVELDDDGNILWENNFGGYYDDDPKSISQTSDGGFIVTGYSTSEDGDVSGHHGNDYISSDCWTIKVDASGNKLWENSFGGTSDERCWSVKQLVDDSYIMAGWTASNDGDASGSHGDVDMWVVKLAPESLLTGEIKNHKITIYPNPVENIMYFSEELNKIEIYSVEGKKILSDNGKEKINIFGLPPGIYIFIAETLNGEKVSSRFIKN